MQLPIVSTLRELDGPPRRFLLFIAFNLVSWQCIVGPALILFARKIDMPASWVGFLISFMPLSTILVVITSKLVTRLGPKRVMLSAWFLRNVIACTVFLVPFAMATRGVHAGWYVLMGSTLAFCLTRALGAGGWFPWLHEVVPARQRAAYFGTETSVGQLLNVAVSFMLAMVLKGDPSIWRFLSVYATGIFTGLVSLAWMARVPGGGVSRGEASRDGNIASYRSIYRDKGFMRLVLISSLCVSCISWLGSSIIMYLRDILAFSPALIMTLTAIGGCSVLATIRSWTRYIERSGSGKTVFLLLTGHSIAAIACLGLWPDSAIIPHVPIVVAVIVATSICSAAFGVAVNRAMLDRMDPQRRVTYTNVWTVGTALGWGLTPILAGHVIEIWGIWGFRACFLVSGCAGIVCAWGSRRLIAEMQEEASGAVRHAGALRRLVAALAEAVTVTAGLEHSEKTREQPEG
ncbi:MAG TPA: MFS transporter [Candidatus Hydrogenedentes bacterium]|nr:MFS transporter [Candidatus Hydrogenedentota bacterium]HOS03475.1 MFS transporter [Candidatus Hydrogenedentota bacterium]